MISLSPLGKQNNLISCQINAAMTFTCGFSGPLNVAFAPKRTPHSLSLWGKMGWHAGKPKVKKGWAAGLKRAPHAGVALSPMWGVQEQAEGAREQEGEGDSKKLLAKKKALAAIFFLQPDIKKITENTSIRWVNCVFLACSVQCVQVQMCVHKNLS